jgi:hypothetical protein
MPAIPTPTGPVETKDIVDEKILTLSLIEYEPETLKVHTTTPLEIYRTVIGRYYYGVHSYRYGYNLPSNIRLEDDAVIFEFKLMQPNILVDSYPAIVSYPVVLGLWILNKLDEPVIVRWDHVSYVDQEGVAHKVAKLGKRYIENTQPVGDILIPPGAKIEESLLPADYVSFSGRGWRSKPGLESLMDKERVTVFVPVEIGGKVRNYRFTFEAEKPIKTQKQTQL